MGHADKQNPHERRLLGKGYHPTDVPLPDRLGSLLDADSLLARAAGFWLTVGIQTVAVGLVTIPLGVLLATFIGPLHLFPWPPDGSVWVVVGPIHLSLTAAFGFWAASED